MSYYLGDYAEDYATLNLKFTTRTTAGVPSTLGGTPVISVYKANDLTQSVAGITLTADFDGVTGLNNVLIDLSADAFYAITNDYQVVITTGTVNGVSVVGEVVGEFSIENRFDQQTGDSYAIVNDSVFGNSAIKDAVGNLSVGSAAISVVAESFTKSGAEPETNTYTASHTLDGVLHIVEDVATATDAYYEFDVGGSGVPVAITWTGYAQSNGDSYDVYAWNYGTTTYEQIGTIPGANGTTLTTETFIYTTAHVGTGANLGKVRFRFLSADGTAFATDRLTLSYSVVQETLGFVGGAVWYDDVGGEAGTETGIGGISRPSSVIADARTIADNNNLRIIHCLPGSTVTLAQNFDDFEFIGFNYTMNFNGQSVDRTGFVKGEVSGTFVGNPFILECIINNITGAGAGINGCRLAGDILANGAGDWYINNWVSGVAGLGSPSFDFGAAVANTNLNMRMGSGGIELKNMGAVATDQASIEGFGQIILNANCVGGTLATRGCFMITDNAGGVVTVSEDARYDVNQIRDAMKLAPTAGSPAAGSVDAHLDDIITDIADVDTLATAILVDTSEIGTAGAGLTDVTINAASVDAIYDEATSGHNVGGSFGKAMRQVKEGTVSAESTVNDAGATTTAFITDLTSVVDDYYKDVSLTFIDGALVGQSRPIQSYNGTTKAITLDEALTSAPANGVGFIIKTDHVHPITQIQSGLATEAKQDIIDANVDSILVDTDTTIPALIAALNDLAASDVLTTQLTESYAVDGVEPTLSQALFIIQQFLFERATSSTTLTVKKLDGSTTAATATLDDASTPTSITRST